MKFLKRFFLAIIFVSPLTGIFANDPPPGPLQMDPPPPPPREGPMKRGGGFPEDDNDPFKMIFLKSFTDDKFLFIDFCFNKAIKRSSIEDATILVDDEPVDKECIMISRDGHKFRVAVEIEDEFSILVEGIEARHGFVLPLVEVEDIEKDSFYKIDEESGKWQKFSW